MTQQATGTFSVTSWDENAYIEGEDGAKLTRAHITKTFEGDIEGEGILEYLMTYTASGSASFVGMERIVGKIGNRSGSFVLQHVGTDDGSGTKINMAVVPGSGTGDLTGLEGEGNIVLEGHAEKYPMMLAYSFATG